ncbi:MAG: NUDIX hydrolase [Gemmatimonadetes bacterium]|nr:NUDIX hydrolase [Gemmatimonadota bacterium]
MHSPPPERLASRRAYAGRIVQLDIDTFRAPSGSILELEIIRHAGAAAVVPLLSPVGAADPSILLIRQYRYAAGGVLWEIPAGVLEPGESPLDCARRELREETGASAESFQHLTTIFTTPGFTDEQIHLFLASGITTGDARPAPDEFMEVQARPMSRVLEMIRDGEIRDGKSIAALLFAAGFRLGL